MRKNSTLLTLLFMFLSLNSWADDSTWSFVWDTNRSSGGEGFYNVSDHSQLVQVQTLNGLEWTLESDSHATGFTASAGQYFGSAAYPITHGTLSTSNLQGVIKKVSVEAKTKTSAEQVVTIGVSVGGVNYGDVTLTAEQNVYDFAPEGDFAEGEIVITMDQTSETKGIINFFSMEIVYDGEGVVTPPVDQPVISAPEVDIKGGTFNEPVTVTITSDDPLCKAIWYSTTLTDVDDMGYDEETVIVPGNKAVVTISESCTLLAVAVGDNNIGLPALYEFVINEAQDEPTITEQGVATGSFHTFYFGERELEHIGVPYEKYSDGRVVLKEFAQGNDFTIIFGSSDEYGRVMLDFEDISGVGAHDVYTYPGYETWPFPVYQFDTPLPVGEDEMIFIFVDGSSNYNPSYDRAVFDYHSAIDGEEYMFNIDFAVPFTGDTGVKNITTDENRTVIYDLQGRRLEKLQRGINIVGGKKVMVK